MTQKNQQINVSVVSDQKDNLLLRGYIQHDHRYLLGEPVLVRLSVTNRGRHAAVIPFERYGSYRTLSLTSIFPDGRQWPQIESARDYDGPRPVELMPQESRQELYNVYSEFPISEPGIYRLNATLETDGRWRHRVAGELIEGDGWSGLLHIHLGEVEIVRPQSPEDRVALRAVTPPEGRGPLDSGVRYPLHGALERRESREVLIQDHPDSYYTAYARYFTAESTLRELDRTTGAIKSRAAQRALGHLEAIDRQKYPLLFQEMVLHRLILAHVGAGSDAATLRPLVEEFRQEFPDSPYELPDAARAAAP